MADDNVDSARTLSLLLTSDGHDVQVADDGEDALKLFRTFSPQIRLLHVGMPKLNGYEVARRVRSEDRSILLIATTGWGQDSDRANALDAGFNHHLAKPIDYQELKSIIGAFGQHRR